MPAVLNPEDVQAKAKEPEAEPEETGVGLMDDGSNNKDLPQPLIDGIKELLRERMMQEGYDRRQEILGDRKRRFYFRGYQHLCFQGTGNQTAFAIAVPGTVMSNSYGEDVECPSSVKDYNIFTRFALLIVSVLTQNSPGIDFLPDDPNSSEDIQGADAAESYRQYFDRCNDVKDIQTQMALMFMLSGRAVSYTYTDENPHIHGYEKDGVTPRKVQRAKVLGTLETKVPILAREQSDCPYTVLANDYDVNILRERYADFKEKIHPGKEGIGEMEYERLARLGVLQGTKSSSQVGDALYHMTTEQICFFRPCEYNSDKLKGQFIGDGASEPTTIGEALREMFPDGIKAIFVGQEYCGCWGQAYDNHLHIDFPAPGDGMARQAAMEPMVTLQDDFNDGMNAFWELGEYGWPRRWVDCEEEDLDAIVEQKASPYAYGAKKNNSKEKPLADSFWQEPDPNIPTSLYQHTLSFMGSVAQFILAAPPSLQGEASPDLKTASTYAQAKASAMGQQGIPWMGIQRMWARIYQNAAKLAHRDNADGEIVVPQKGGTPRTWKLEKLAGNWGAYPDQDSSFPETTAAKRQNFAQLMQMAATNPTIGAEILSEPDNWEEAKTLLGIPGIVVRSAEARNKQLAEIESLLGNDPVPPSQEEIETAEMAHAQAMLEARASGMPMPPPFDPKSLPRHSSVTPELTDMHELEAAKCEEYLSSQAARDYDASGGDYDGLTNIRLHWMEHIQMAPKKNALKASMMAPIGPPPQLAPAPPRAMPKPQGPPLHATAIPAGAPGAPTT